MTGGSGVETLVAGLDVRRSRVVAWVRGSGRPLAEVTAVLPTARPGPDRVELVPAAWEAACRGALAAAVARAGRPGLEYLAVTVSAPRRGFVLLDAAGEPLGAGVLDGDRRGAPYAAVLAGRQGLTGQQPSGELALPGLLAVRAKEPQRWAATARVLSLHDWLVRRLCGAAVVEVSYACAAGMADVAARGWATGLLTEAGVDLARLAPVVEPGTVVGELRPGWGPPATLPVVTGCGDVLLAAVGAGGLAEDVVVVVGAGRRVVAATRRPVPVPAGRLTLSTHAAPGLWAVEGAGAPPGSDLAAQAFAVRRDLEDLEDGRAPGAACVVADGAASDDGFAALLAQVLGRAVRKAPTRGVAEAGELLAARALGVHAHPPGLPDRVLAAGDASPWQEPYDAWVDPRPR